MKKLFSLLLALCMMLACCASAEAVDMTGVWYADLMGMTMTLTLNADNTYTMDMMGEADDGTWAQTETGVLIDDEMPMVYNAEANTLVMDMDGMELVFGREAAAAFVAAEARTDATVEEFAGCWLADKIGFMGMTMSTTDIGMGLAFAINDTTVTMYMMEGEQSFAEAETVDLPAEFADGALTIVMPAESEESAPQSFVLKLLADGTLACETSMMEETMTFYMNAVEALVDAPVEEVPAA
jgi:hypothetical protein